MKTRIIAAFLALVLLCPLLASCGESKTPSLSDEATVNLAADRLLSSLRGARSFSLDGTYESAVGSAPSSAAVLLSDAGRVVGTGSVRAGSLSVSLVLSGERTENGTKTEYEDRYTLADGELDCTHNALSGGTVPIAELLPLTETAETVQAILTLLPYLAGETSSLLAASGVGYTADDLYAFFSELASLYRLLLLRVGQGQVLTVPAFEGSAVQVLAEHGRVTLDADGIEHASFTLPMRAVIAPLLDRMALLLEMSISEAIDRLSGAGTSDRLLSAIAQTESEETLGAWLTRLEGVLFGDTVERGTLLAVLDALLFLADAEELSEILTELSDLRAIEALRALTGDPSLSTSDAGALVSAMLASTPRELLRSIGRASDPSQRLSSLGEAARAVRFELSFPCKETAELPLKLSFSYAGETDDGHRSICLALALSLDGTN